MYNTIASIFFKYFAISNRFKMQLIYYTYEIINKININVKDVYLNRK